MFIQLTDPEDKPVWVNTDAVVAFVAADGGTKLIFSREDESFYASVKEEPYTVLARIRAEENLQRRGECK